MVRAYGILCRAFGAAVMILGVGFVSAFLGSIAPGGGTPFPFPIGPNGLYFVAFTGCCLVAWGGCLFAAARASGTPGAGGALARGVGTATAVGLVLNAIYRMAVWLMGDFAWVGELPRVEAAIFLVLALVFLLLRPAASAEAA